MTDQIPADKVQEVIDDMDKSMNEPAEGSFSAGYDNATSNWKRHLETLLLPTPPTLADMTLDEQDECAGMQADLAQGDRVVILDGTPDAAGLVQVLEKSLDVYRAYPKEVTPHPDLPRMEWPGDQKPVPALPEGWRLADHKVYGRVIVTMEKPDDDGELGFIHRGDGLRRQHAHDWCQPDELTFLDQGDDTPTGPGHLAVGSVIESADDPRIAALPVGSILLDREGDTTTKQIASWAGIGYTPIPSEGETCGPWTVLYIPKEADQ